MMIGLVLRATSSPRASLDFLCSHTSSGSLSESVHPYLSRRRKIFVKAIEEFSPREFMLQSCCTNSAIFAEQCRRLPNIRNMKLSKIKKSHKILRSINKRDQGCSSDIIIICIFRASPPLPRCDEDDWHVLLGDDELAAVELARVDGLARQPCQLAYLERALQSRYTGQIKDHLEH